MELLVLGLTGRRGCGKDAMAGYLMEKYGFRVLTYTDHVLAPLLRVMGKGITRDNLIALALDLRAKSGKHILTRMICDLIGPSGTWAVSGVRYPEEDGYFRQRLGGSFRLVAIASGTRKRFERVKKRATKGEGSMTFGQFMEVEGKETERMIGETLKLADFTVANDGSLEDFHRRIDGLCRKLGIRTRSGGRGKSG
jgi:dephospho-CoA kinase